MKHLFCGEEHEFEKLTVLLLLEFRERLERMEGKENTIMAAIDDLKTALDKIDAASTAQGTVLAGEATTLQTISDELDALLANPGVPADVAARAQALADKVAAVSTTIQSNADFSTALASKGAGNPVPTPVPAPTA